MLLKFLYIEKQRLILKFVGLEIGSNINYIIR